MSEQRKPKGLKFLDAYDKKDIDIYFGRKTDIDNLYDRVAKNNLTVVCGFSGTGKTSLIQCGLANRFSDIDWMDLLIRKKKNSTILECTFEAIQNVAKTLLRQPSDNLITENFILECLDVLYRDYFRTVYLIYDQFEEIFVLGSEREKIQFFSFLQQCTNSTLDVKVIIVVREEYIGRLYEFEKRDFRLLNNCFRVQQMSQLEIIDDVLKNIFLENGIDKFETWPPVNHSRLSLELMSNSWRRIDEHEVAEADTATKESSTVLNLIYNTIRDPETRMVDLPSMQVYLDKLIKSLPEKRSTLTIEDIYSLGKLEDVLSTFLDETVDSISKKQNCKPEDIWTILNSLVSVNNTKQGLKLEEIKNLIIV